MAKKVFKIPVSVVIPTYNGLSLLQKNLPAVFACLGDGDEVVIVDDASTDTSLRWLKDAFNTRSRKIKRAGKIIPTQTGAFVQAKKRIIVTIIAQKRNLRFAKSANKGVLAAKHSLVFLLNSDVSPDRTVLRYLVPYFKQDQVFAVGCMELGTDDKGNQTKQGKNTIRFQRGMFIHAKAADLEPGPTAWATGGSSLFNREKWLKLGGFDADYAPAYWEDIDLSFRAQRQGWKVLFEPKAKVDHNHETTNSDVFGQQKIYQMSWNNAQKFVKKNGNWWQKLLHLLWKPYWLIKTQ